MVPQLILFGCQLAFRLWAKSVYDDAVEDQRNAHRDYEESLRAACAAQVSCIATCQALDANRAAMLDGRWNCTHTFLVACGVNGGLFAPPRQVFGKWSEDQVRLILSTVEVAKLIERDSTMKSTRVIRRSSLAISSFTVLDSTHVINAPFLHKNLHEALSSLDSAASGTVAAAAGGAEDLTVGGVIGGTLDAVSVAVSGLIFAAADDVAKKASRLREKARELDEQRARLEAGERRGVKLLGELDTFAYELLKWTVVSEEVAQLQRKTHGRRRNVADLPRWALAGLLHKAKCLWRSLEEPVFG